TYTPPEGVEAVVSRKWRNLDGAANDVETIEAILKTRFGFEEIHKLKNREATRDAIFAGITDWLVAPSKPGDVVVFYYAGHGSQVRNTESRESDGLDETIVPTDSWNGAHDIRDKELRDAFNALLAKGVTVTLIFDSCHSGSITRGLPSGKSRYIEPSPLTVSDASDPPKPVEQGALILSASQDDEVARELSDEFGNPRGAFTWALSKAIEAQASDETAEQLFQRARAILRSTGAKQEPVIAGNSERRTQSVLGSAVQSRAASVPVIEVDSDGTVIVQGGIATGLRPGAELVKYDADSTITARIEITQSDGLARSRGALVEGDSLPEAGDLFDIERWVSNASAPLRLFMPQSLGSYAELSAALAPIEALVSSTLIEWVDDPTETPPDAFVYWSGEAWQLVDPEGIVTDLGRSPSADEILSVISTTGDVKPRLFVSIPPFAKFGDRLDARFAKLDASVERVDTPAQASYLLVGRVPEQGVGAGIEYAWILREATVGIESSPAPERSDWHLATEKRLFAASILGRDINKLNVIWGWLNLQSPPDDGTFPYIFGGFENVSDGSRRFAGDTLLVGEKYRVVLETSFAELEKARVKAMSANVERRFLYFFIMDRSGNGYLLYPAVEYGNVENDVVLFSDLPTEIKIPSADGVLFEVAEPVGIDSFFLISTAQPIPQPGVFNFEGIRTRGPASGAQTDLSKLFHALGSGTRGAKQPVPTSWSMDRITVRSAPTRN
ncbi:MAG: caspase family protein, partial [Rhodothermales bacterium]|nr:caspase family protein [Rhodothermales bacterium]